MSEYKLHRAGIDYLKGRIRKGKQFFPVKKPFPELYSPDGKERFSHIYQGRDEAEGFFLAEMGLRRGLLDIIMWWPGKNIAFVDAKHKTSYTREQRQFIEDLARCGFTQTGKWYSVVELRDLLIGFGLRCENPTVFEADLRTDSEKKQDGHNYFAPVKK